MTPSGGGTSFQFPDEVKAAILTRLQSYMLDEFDQDIGDLRALKVFEFMVGLIGASAYNQGVADAQAWLAQRLDDMSGNLYEEVDWDG